MLQMLFLNGWETRANSSPGNAVAQSHLWALEELLTSFLLIFQNASTCLHTSWHTHKGRLQPMCGDPERTYCRLQTINQTSSRSCRLGDWKDVFASQMLNIKVIKTQNLQNPVLYSFSVHMLILLMWLRTEHVSGSVCCLVVGWFVRHSWMDCHKYTVMVPRGWILLTRLYLEQKHFFTFLVKTSLWMFFLPRWVVSKQCNTIWHYTKGYYTKGYYMEWYHKKPYENIQNHTVRYKLKKLGSTLKSYWVSPFK